MNERYLVETPALDFSSEPVQRLLPDFPAGATDTEKALTIYYLVRDFALYDPYHLDLRPEFLKASVVAGKKRAWCVEKSVLMAAMLRAAGIPSRLGFGIVKNHIGVEKLLHYLKRPEIVFHGFVEVFLGGNWVKCTPAFDRKICRLAGVEPLSWNGYDDSLFQEYTHGKRHMEYLKFYGSFDDVPFALMHAEMKEYYPHLFEHPVDEPGFSFHY